MPNGFKTSSYCSMGGCVGIRQRSDGGVDMTDTKVVDSPVIGFSHRAWSRFTTEANDGKYGLTDSAACIKVQLLDGRVSVSFCEDASCVTGPCQAGFCGSVVHILCFNPTEWHEFLQAVRDDEFTYVQTGFSPLLV